MAIEYLEIRVANHPSDNQPMLQCKLLSPDGATLVGETRLPSNLPAGDSVVPVALKTILAGQTWKRCGQTSFLSRENPDATPAEYCMIDHNMTSEKAGWFKTQYYFTFAAHRITPEGLVGPLAQTGRFKTEESRSGEQSLADQLKQDGWAPVPGSKVVFARPKS